MVITLKRAGYEKVETPINAPCFAKQVRLGNRSIYNKEMRHDTVCWHPEKHPNGLIIEAKYQATAGSVDEKYPYTVLSLKRLDAPSILVLEGGGATQSAIDWCMAQADEKFRVFDGISAFIRAVNNGLL